MKNRTRRIALLLSVIMLMSLVPAGHAENEDILERVNQLLHRATATPAVAATAAPEASAPEQAEDSQEADPGNSSEPENEETSEQSDESAVSVDTKGSLSIGLAQAKANTSVYSDKSRKQLLGVIVKQCVVHVISVSDNVARIALLHDSKVYEGYADTGCFASLSQSARILYLVKANGIGKTVYGQKLLNVAFTLSGRLPAATATPKVTATPKPTATPKATATPKVTDAPQATATPSSPATQAPTAVPKGYPVIVTQPASVDGKVGQRVIFSVRATNVLTYYWQCSSDNGKTWTDLTNASFWIGNRKATLYFTAQDRYNGYLFRCKLTNSVGTVYTDPVYLNLGGVKKLPPVINTQPASVSAKEKTTVTFHVAATDAVQYQWQYSADGSAFNTLTNGSVWAGNTTDTLSFTAEGRYNGYAFRCAVSNAQGTVYSDSAVLTVQSASKPVIITQPAAASVPLGGTAVFSVSASGADSYQWEYYQPGGSWAALTNSAFWNGNRTDTLSFEVSSTKYGSYLYRCRLTNSQGTVYTDAVSLTILTAATATPKPTATPKVTATPALTAPAVQSKPVFSVNPIAQTVTEGQQAVFTAAADGATTYQWQYSTNGLVWTNLTEGGIWSGTKSERLTFTADVSFDQYSFRLRAANDYGNAYSAEAVLTVKEAAAAAVSITGQPEDAACAAGGTVTFRVTAENATGYQWYSRSGASGSWTKLSASNGWTGATADTLSFKAQSGYNGYQFRCRVSGQSNSVYSSAATLTLVVRAPYYEANLNTAVQAAVGSYVTLSAKAAGATEYQWQMNPNIGYWVNVTETADSQNTRTSAMTIKVTRSGLKYTYRLKATNTYGSTYSPVFTLTEMIAQPTNVRAAAAGRNAISVTWTASDDTRVKRYNVYYNTVNKVDYSQYMTVTAASTQLTGLAAGTTYHVWVQAVGASVASEVNSNVHASAATQAPLAVPGAPTGVSASPSATSISVSWKKPANSETDGYYVYYRTYGANASQKITVSGGSVLSASVTGLNRSTRYQVWVTAYNESGEGSASATVTVTTLSAAAAPAQPTSVKAVSAGASSVKVTWNASASAGVAGYNVYYGTGTSADSAVRFGSYSGSTSSATVTGLKSENTYYFWVTAYNQDGAESAMNSAVMASAKPTSVSSAGKINAVTFSKMGDKYIGYSYSTYDCQAFVEQMLADAGLRKNLAGSNAWYRQMTWRGTPEQCKAIFGCIPTGAFLFIVAYDGGEPSTYRDNLGNANHIGVVTHRNQGAIHSSYTRGGVYTSYFADATIPNGGWNMVGLWIEMDYGEEVNAILSQYAK